ncbi:MAG: hypothetical protein KC931_26910, partial [Candidatus Omnitrophica bacterium]|nr:hypothetical protein [Candidatus Omnitrophota bacterium]
LPDYKEYKERNKPINEKLITASDYQFKRIPVGTREAKDLLEPLMAEGMKFLMIQGSMRDSKTKGTEFSDDLKILVNPESSLTTFLEMHRGAFGSTDVQRAQ